jgi:hypothetical protein
MEALIMRTFNKIIFSGAILSIVLSLILFSCNMVPPVTIEDRISQFMAELNKADRTNVYTHVHSDATSYNTIKPAAYWDGIFATGNTYSLSGLSVTSPTATATCSGGAWSGSTFNFTMKETDPKVWKILRLTSNGPANPIP